MRKLQISNIDGFFSSIAKSQKLYIPCDTDGGAAFMPWSEGMKLSDALNTVRSAKDFFFPQTENLMEFKFDGKKISINDIRSENEDFVIFGVRACDVRSFDILDKVFLSNPVDTYYKNRREHAVIISLACEYPAETCFCGTFGIDASEPEGDIVCCKTDESLYLNAVTEKGKKLLTMLDGITEECDSSAVSAQKELIRSRLEKLPLASPTKDAIKKFEADGDKTKEFFNDENWASLSEACLGCGTCTFVCPTCQCYDIKDFNTGSEIKRFRCWDSCMYSDFTKMSAGQPRISQKERFRQRFMHKLVYFPANNEGVFGCVGCGRCVSRCPIKMNIVKVMRSLGKGGTNNDN